MAIFAVGASGHDRNVSESAVVIVVEQHAGLRVHGNIDVRPPVVVKIIGDGRNRIAGTGLQDSRLLRDIRKCAVAIVVKEYVGIPRKTARTAHGRNALPLALRRIFFRRSVFRI